MCGHGMISHSLAKKMIDFVKENRRSPEQAATYLSRFCSCGIFNPARARGFLKMPGRIRSSVLTCLVLLFATSLVAEVKVLKNFTLIDGTGHAPLPHAAMILDDGRIQWVGPEAQLKAPPAARVIDLQSKYVMPGDHQSACTSRRYHRPGSKRKVFHP